MRNFLALLLVLPVLQGADLDGSKDPPGMKRYEGSQIIGYRSPRFDEYVLPLSPAPDNSKTLSVEGQLSRYTYAAPEGRTATELLRNYKLEFQRLGLETLYEKKVGERGWFGPGFEKIADEDGLGQILAYNEADERLIVGKSHDPKPSYFLVFVTSYKDGVIPERLQGTVKKGRALVEVVAITPDVLEQRMAFVNADEMNGAIGESGKVALYGILFDTDKDSVKPESQPTLNEIVKLMKSAPQLHLHVVGHTDNQGKPEYNVDLSRRRAASVVRELTAKGIIADRLDSFGAGPYSPLASNTTVDGRAKNRRVELVQ